MARRVFFSFHYERDIWRVNQVRNHWLTKPDRESAGYWDSSLWEATKLRGDAAIRRLIDEGMVGSSVTAVLIGRETALRTYCNYEIAQSCALRKGMFGVYIHQLKNKEGLTDLRGLNPFDSHYTSAALGQGIPYSRYYRTYDWVLDNGFLNFSSWVEAAAREAGR